MLKRLPAFAILFGVAALFALCAVAQQDEMRLPGAVYDFDKKNETPKPAPKHDISGVWEPAAGYNDGVAATGAKAMPADGKPEHELPYTAEGRKAFLAHKPTFGVTQVEASITNDPVPACNPQGFPRIVLHNFRTSRIVQTAENVIVLYEFNKKWRVIWTDGRLLPKDPQNPSWGAPDPPESRWWGYSVGKWADDYTFVAESNGFDDRTWLDNAGRPHSDLLHVIERYRRTDRDHLEITITIDDPKMYTKPWEALRLRERLQEPSFDIHEMECAPMETEAYNKDIADPAIDK
jgi:hypothetical protein